MTLQTLPDGLLVSWLGDDFTGSAAVMEVLSFAGLPSVLFQDIPTPAQLARFEGMRGIGLASTARAQSPDWMAAELPARFEWLARLKAPLSQYKICSTLDSAPHIGSIGKAIELALDVFDTPFVPVMPAAPAIGRYQAFGTLFAAGQGKIHRLDRHPSMAQHPITPMDEADVCTHLARQTGLPLATLDAAALQTDAPRHLSNLLETGARLIALDTVNDDHLQTCGDLIWDAAQQGVLAAGSQGIEYALVAAWTAAGLIDPPKSHAVAGSVERIVVVSGSASLVTEAQIAWGQANGFAPIRVAADALARGDARAEDTSVNAALSALEQGQDPILFTALGPNDPAIASVTSTPEDTAIAQRNIGEGLGRILHAILTRTGLTRSIVAGGDTSGHVMRALDVYAFTALAPTIPGAALLKAHSDAPALDGLQVALKGGQMGSPDYFGWIKAGGGSRPAHKPAQGKEHGT